MALIEWRHNREQLHLKTVFMPEYSSESSSDSERVDALPDTGATGTGIHPAIVERLLLRKKGQRRVNTANGMILAPEYVVRIGFICGDHRDPLFHSQSEQPYMIERKLIAFGMQRGFLMRR